MPQKNYSPVITTKTQNNYTIKNPFAFRTYMSAMTVLTTNEFKIHGKANIRIEKLNIIKDSDQELLKTSDSITYPTSTLVLDPYDTIYIDLESDNPEVEVGIAVLFVLSTDPLPVGYAIEPENQAEIRSLFSNVDGERILFKDESRDIGDQYATVNMQGYKNVYVTLISRANDLEIDNASNRLKNATNVEHFKTFFRPNELPSQLSIRINRKPDPAPDFSLQFSLRFRTSLVGTLKPSALVNPQLYFTDDASNPILYDGAVDFDLSVTDEGYYTYLRFKINARDIPPESNERYAALTFNLDGSEAEDPASYSGFAYEITYTNQPETGQAHLTFEINANDIWVELDDFPSIFVNVNGTKTVLVGEYSGHILPSGNNILRARLEMRDAPLRTEVVLLRV